jgi:hypothetical protein
MPNVTGSSRLEAVSDTGDWPTGRRVREAVIERDGDDVVARSSGGEAGLLLTGPHVPMRLGRWTELFRLGTEQGVTTSLSGRMLSSPRSVS